MDRILVFVSGTSLLLLLGVLMRLAALEAAGPTHWDLSLPGGIPATMYLPDGPDGASSRMGRRFRAVPLPEAERPMAVVLVHGFASDRRNMSPLLRRPPWWSRSRRGTAFASSRESLGVSLISSRTRSVV